MGTIPIGRYPVPMRANTRTLALVAVVALAGLAACGDDTTGNGGGGDGDDDRLVVAAAFFPLEEIARNVGGDLVEVLPLVPPGEAAHDYEPTPKQIAALESADLVVYLGDDFQPGIEKALESLPDSVRRLDLLEGLDLLPADAGDDHEEADEEDASEGDDHDHGATDPHVWLDPANMASMAATVAAALVELDPALASPVDTALGEYTDGLDALDASFTEGLASCESTLLVTGHRAFAYLAVAYGLTQVSIAGISPGEEPSAQTLEEVAALAAENGVTTIFFEENLPADLSRTVADEVGADTAVLDPVESPSSEQLDDGATYGSLMSANLAALRDGLRCS